MAPQYKSVDEIVEEMNMKDFRKAKEEFDEARNIFWAYYFSEDCQFVLELGLYDPKVDELCEIAKEKYEKMLEIDKRFKD